MAGYRRPWLRPLPRSVSPLINETIESYIGRLARANHLKPTDLRSYVTDSPYPKSVVPVERLAAVSGVPANSLRYAMLELCHPRELAAMNVAGRARPGHAQQAGCRRCASPQGVVSDWEHVRVWARHEDVVCPRHRQWTDTDKASLDLSAHPEIVQANRLHRRLIRRHGRPAVQLAYQDALEISRRRLDKRNFDDAFDRRLDQFLGPEWKYASDEATFRASYYPETVHLARLLASPYWTSLLLDDHIQRDPIASVTIVDGQPLTWLDTMFTKHFAIRLSTPGIERFVAEGKRTIAPGFQWIPEPRSGIHSTLGGWVLDRLLERAGLQAVPSQRLRPEPDAFSTQNRNEVVARHQRSGTT